MQVKRKWTILLFLLLLMGGIVWNWWTEAQKPVSPSGQETIFVVQSGMSAGKVGLELEQKGIIRSARAFNIVARLEKVDAKLKAGDYRLAPSMDLREIIAILLQGPQLDYVVVTIPEGYYLTQIINTLVEKGLGTKEEYEKVISSQAFAYEFLEGIPPNIDKKKRLEGFLFPDTYFFDPQSNPGQVIERLLARFNQEVTPEVKAKLKERKLSLYEWVTLASIVEKEAVKAEDRELIAGVIGNRLKRDMLLQIDSTIQYLLGKQQAVIYLRDLQTDSPYNTYKYKGLPPGPISSPGRASLAAALNPAKTDYLYFVAKSDGYHVFAKTYEEQLRNQALYQNPETVPK